MSSDTAQKLPVVWNVPFARNRSFTGREDELDRLHSLFASNTPGAAFQALSGLGGVGKTQLALEYAYLFASSYDVVWWLRAEEPATLAADFADLAMALRLPGRNESDQRVSIEIVKQWLSRSGRWLLIFDSVREPRDVAPYLTPAGTGHVLVTSRHAAWRGVATPLPMRGLKRDDAIAFLLSRTGSADTDPTAQDEPAAQLAEALGDLPLALAQAGAYIEESGTTIAAYLDLFQRRQEELLRRGAGSESAPTVATTWDIAIRDARSRSPAAAELLNLCAFLAPDDIPRDALGEGADRFPPVLAATVKDPLALGDAVAALRRYSLIEVLEDGISVHRLVQAVVRERLPDDERKAWVERAASLVNQVFPTDLDDPAVRSLGKRWLPHVRAVAERAGAAGVAQETIAQVLYRAAKLSRKSGAYKDSRELFLRALGIATAIYGPDHAKVAAILSGLALALVLGDLGDPAEARRYAERALAIDEARLGTVDMAVARDLNNLAHVSWRFGELDKARAYVERAIKIHEEIRGADDPELIRRLNNRGFLLREMRDLEGARQLLERALALGESRLGPDDPDVATFHSNLAAVLEELGEYPAAREHLERALSIGEAFYGPDHYAVAIRRNNLGVLLRTMGDLRSAREQLERAVEIGRKALGPDHRRVLKFERNLDAVIAAQRGYR